MTESTESPQWWGAHEVPEEGLTLQIGALVLLVQRDPREWHLAHRRDGTLGDEAAVISQGADFDASPLAGERRVLVRDAGRALELLPAPRPVKPLRLPAGERIDLFVGTPLFVLFRLPAGPELDELPLIVPPETWFGPSPVRGELCYSARTRAAIELDELPRNLNRALTRVTLINHAKDAMNVERIRLPVTRLRLGFDDSIGRFVTDDVELERESDGETANLEIRALPKTARALTPPREPARSAWKHALSALWA